MALKTVLFFLSFMATIFFIEDAIENIIINSRKSSEVFHAEYELGITNTFSWKLALLTGFLWTAFYLANQI